MENEEFRFLANSLGLTKAQFLDVILQKNIKPTSENIKRRLNKLFPKKTGHNNTSELKKVSIFNLFEKGNDYCFDFTDDINIFVSENGKGKTTILRLIVAVLEKDISTINEIDFSKIIFDFIDNTKIEIDKETIYSDFKEEYENCLRLLRNVISRKDYIELQEEFSNKKRYNTEKIEDFLTTYLRVHRDGSYNLRNVRDQIRELNHKQHIKIEELLKENFQIDLLFYPTYRRIESPKEKLFYSAYRDDVRVKNKYISFGMNDVQDCIDSFLDEIKISTNIAYAAMTSEIINDLIKNNLQDLPEAKRKINKIKFDIVMDRIGKESIKNYKDLSDFIDTQKESDKPELKYYINKLSSIYDRQEQLTSKIKNFVHICNKYLVNKEFIYNESELKLEIKVNGNKHSNLELEDLSSGEKQIVSIFAKVYLDTALPSIFIIDEPELSLSLEWQKDFLMDIYDSNKVSLLIATTHSPFIFEQGLINFTKNINVCKKEE